MLTCPYCQHQFALNWTRYRKAGPGRYVCPSCWEPSTLRLPLWLKTGEYVVLIGGHIAIALGGIMLVILGHTGPGLLMPLVGIVFWLGLNIPLNIVLDGYYGRLETDDEMSLADLQRFSQATPPPLPPKPAPPPEETLPDFTRRPRE